MDENEKGTFKKNLELFAEMTKKYGIRHVAK